jgi:hypothetical protein
MGRHCKLYFTLEKLGFKKPIWITNYLAMHNIIKSGEICHRDQFGGGNAETIYYNKYKFYYVKDSDYHIYSYGSDENQCILLLIPKKNKYGECRIQGLNNAGKCVIDDMYYNKKGTFLLELTFGFIKRMLKDKHNLRIITLADNSKKHCTGNSIFMADMYFLLNGNTWYGKYGFRPYDGEGHIDDDMNKIYLKNQQIHSVTKIKDVEDRLKYYLHKFNTHYFSDASIDILITKNREMKLSKFLKILLKEYDKTCAMFGKFYHLLMNDIGMKSFNGKTFFAKL